MSTKPERKPCPVCGEQFTVTKSGGMRWHCGDIWRAGVRQMCNGVGMGPAKPAQS